MRREYSESHLAANAASPDNKNWWMTPEKQVIHSFQTVIVQVEDLAALNHISARQLSRKLKSLTGFTAG